MGTAATWPTNKTPKPPAETSGVGSRKVANLFSGTCSPVPCIRQKRTRLRANKIEAGDTQHERWVS